MQNTTFSFVFILLLTMGCQPQQDAQEIDKEPEQGAEIDYLADDSYPIFNAATLVQGRTIWLGTCKNCHAIGVAGAPPVWDKAAWAPRIEKGKETLYEHAINGFFGEDFTMMPPRGGNDTLTNEQVQQAVDYMIAVASQ